MPFKRSVEPLEALCPTNARAAARNPAEAKTGKEGRQHSESRATGSQTLETIWGLFETAVQLDTKVERKHLLDTAIEISQCQNLEDWIKQ